jgi:hypothetical protein
VLVKTITIYKRKIFLFSITTTEATEVIFLYLTWRKNVCDELENKEEEVIIKVLPLYLPARIKTV